ncbi:siderophore-interacting protein [Blastococcus brunescens]|uniref:Siderophore-interacting protein n=1 Tax=Blastococcus brunescens TaxID=1564165 RepID=A0ABZ1B4L6_9ACTN|nr:siderophore-interacting protein [Blastococcus sp. BMG 8361]WRL65745.1 siderophore-interacting protein [Blastococcus sp. BMG 8361]
MTEQPVAAQRPAAPGRNGGQRGKRKRVPRVAAVVRTERITPHMIRVVLGGDGLTGFPAGEFTDHYVKLLFAPPGRPTAPLRRRAAPGGTAPRAVAGDAHVHGARLGRRDR